MIPDSWFPYVVAPMVSKIYFFNLAINYLSSVHYICLLKFKLFIINESKSTFLMNQFSNRWINQNLHIDYFVESMEQRYVIPQCFIVKDFVMNQNIESFVWRQFVKWIDL